MKQNDKCIPAAVCIFCQLCKCRVVFNQNGFSRNIFVFGSSRPEVVCKKSVLQNFSKFKGKHLCQSLFFIGVYVAT